ncbi:MAG TPA: hypothetical protein VE172_09375 [Stackebrandtia sp.]|uniref:hypothetical protein n=1 Tax=Stackebrandtia sp. TaxID=2023065 RepID=UPI002D31B998|nr:hypothetical protein [Stackebrandtia sp.]HZE39005.1 hypothetical protein [Stackebrandtia sp.]
MMRKRTLWILPLTTILTITLLWTYAALAFGSGSRSGLLSTDASSPLTSGYDGDTTVTVDTSTGVYGITVYDTVNHRATLQYHANKPFKMLSVVKLLIALDTLDSGGDPSEVSDMLRYSDDAIARELWWQGGKTDVIARMTSKIGLSHTKPPDDPIWWGFTTSTASDLVRIYRYILDDAPAPSRRIIMSALEHASRTGSDGFNQYFGIPTAAGSQPWAVKQGWSCCRIGRSLHTTGTVGADHRYIVIVLGLWGKKTTWSADKQAINAVVKSLMPLVE